MTPVTTIFSMATDGGLSAGSIGVWAELFDEEGLPGISFPTPPSARWFLLPAVRGTEELAEIRGIAAMRRLRLPRVGDGGDNFPRYAQAADAVVPGCLVDHDAEERC